MLSLPHLIVLFVIALVIFGPQKLPELARMLGKATAEFRKMSNDFRYALEDEVREMERQTRIRDEEIASAIKAAQTPAPTPAPEGTQPRDAAHADVTPADVTEDNVTQAKDILSRVDSSNGTSVTEALPPSETAEPGLPESASVSQEKPADDHTPA